MGSTQSSGHTRRDDPEQHHEPLRTRYGDFARELLADPLLGPSPKRIEDINECEPSELEPTGESKPPLLALAKDNEQWFGCLIEKCDPRATWMGEDGQKKELGSLLLGNGTCNYAVWCTKLDEWERKYGGSDINGPPMSSSSWGQQEFFSEFRNVALTLGMTTAAAKAGRLWRPASALGPTMWQVIRKWHACFLSGIKSMKLGAQELQELCDCFVRSVKLLVKVIIQFGMQIEAIDANSLDSQVTKPKAELQVRLANFKAILEDDIAEMARIAGDTTSEQEKKRIMVAKLRTLVELCNAQELLNSTRERLAPFSGTLASELMYRAETATAPPQCFSYRVETTSALSDLPGPRASQAGEPSSREEEGTALLVERFDSTPQVYPTSVGNDPGVRLRVGSGCLGEGQVAGPVTVVTDKRYIVESGGSSFLVSAVVDCQPSGARFHKPLELEFVVGEEDKGDKDVSDEEGEDWLASLQKSFQFFWRTEETEAWTPQEGGAVVLDKELGEFVFRTQVDHFCQGCLGKKLDLQNNIQDAIVQYGPPHNGQLEFVNATDKSIVFLVLPTRYEEREIMSLTLGVQVPGIGGVDVGMEQKLVQTILSAAKDCQAFRIPAKKAPGNPEAGQACPFSTCYLLEKASTQARVALVTADSGAVSVWFSRLFNERTQVVILPEMFSDPAGHIGKRVLGEDPFSVVDAGGIGNETCPVATEGGACGAVVAQPDAENTDDKASTCVTM